MYKKWGGGAVAPPAPPPPLSYTTDGAKIMQTPSIVCVLASSAYMHY